MTLPMRLRDTFAQRVLAYVAFCRLLSRTKKRSFLSSSPPFEPTILNSPLFPSKLINFFDCTPRPYTYFLLSKFYSISRIDEFVGKEEKARRISSFSLTIRRFPRCESFERFENLHLPGWKDGVGGVPPFQLLPQGRALSGDPRRGFYERGRIIKRRCTE